MKRLSFGVQLYGVLGLLLAASVFVGVAGLSGLSRTNHGLETVYRDRVVPLEQLKAIADAYAVSVIDAANKANAGVFTAEEAHDAVAGASKVVQANWAAYRATYLTPEEATLAREAETLFAPADAGITALLARLAQLHGRAAGELDAFDGPLYASIDPISGKISELVELQLRVAKEEYDEGVQRFALARVVLGGTVVLAFLLGGGLGIAIVRRVCATLHTTRGHLDACAEHIATAAEQVGASASQLASGATEQSASLEHASASVADIARLTRANAEHTRETDGLMSNLATQMVDSKQALGEMVASMAAIEESSERVSRIIRTIDEIAFQTNILALNAAVEAARAGEAGMGFAVVADEVRSLAQRSASAAKDTENLIEESITRSHGGTARVQQVAALITAMGEGVSRVQGLVAEVTQASQQEARGLDQVAHEIAQIECVTRNTAAAAEEGAAASESLRERADETLQVAHELDALVDGERTVPAPSARGSSIDATPGGAGLHHLRAA